MKIEFVKEEKVDGNIYYTNIDGQYVIGSMSCNFSEAYIIYERIKKAKGRNVPPEVLESTEIDD